MSRTRNRTVRPKGPPPKPIIFVPFGVEGLKTLVAKCKREKVSAEEALLATVIDQLKLGLYTEKDIERVLEEDDLAEQVNTWVKMNRKMLTFGRGGIYQTLKFSVSPRDVEGAI